MLQRETEMSKSLEVQYLISLRIRNPLGDVDNMQHYDPNYYFSSTSNKSLVSNSASLKNKTIVTT